MTSVLPAGAADRIAARISAKSRARAPARPQGIINILRRTAAFAPLCDSQISPSSRRNRRIGSFAIPRSHPARNSLTFEKPACSRSSPQWKNGTRPRNAPAPAVLF